MRAFSGSRRLYPPSERGEVLSVRTADRVVAALVVTLLAGAALERPLRRRLDPAAAARAAYDEGRQTDPWGMPWIYASTSANRRYGPNLDQLGREVFEPRPQKLALVYSSGLNKRFEVGEGDDIGIAVWHGEVPVFRFRSGWEDSFAPRDTAPIALGAAVVLVVLTRCISGRVRRTPTHAGRWISAGAVALFPCVVGLWVLKVADLWPETLPGNVGLVLPVREAVVGSAYALCLLLVFAHRELGDVPPREEAESSTADQG